MDTSQAVDYGTSYVPALVIRRVATSEGPITEPITETLETAVLFADISGFTALTEKLAARGPAGMEELSKIISDYFGCLVDVIVDHGGDIVKFAGDALLALWPATEEESLAVATRRAAQCALAVRTAMTEFAARATAKLELKVALGAGSAICLHVGGTFGRWELLIAGDPFLQAGRAGEHAKPGDIVISREALALLGDTKGGVEVRQPDGTGHMTALPDAIPPTPLTTISLTPVGAKLVVPYVPAAIRSKLGTGGAGWIAELRRITVLFVNLPGVSHKTPIEDAQKMMLDLQRTLYQFEGSVNKLSVDDKGVTFVAVLGLPPFAHEDDPVRGIQAALGLRACLNKLGLDTAIGVTTGRAYCGSVGSPRRREYTIMGDVVNMSARLMQAAKGTILCDVATYEATSDAFAFETLDPIKVKGKTDLIQVYRPLEPSSPTTIKRSTGAIVGRRAELAAVTGQVQALSKGGPGAIVAIEGEAGIGKSRLVEEIVATAEASGLRNAVGAADSIQRSTPYHAWRGVFSSLLGLDQVKEPQARRDRVLELLMPMPTLFRLAPLLNVVLPLDLPENEITAQMTGELRADNTHDLLLGILRNATGNAPMLLIVEDAHWMDSASWSFTRLVARDIKSLLLVLATRPLSAPVPLEYAQLMATPGSVKITLDQLAPEEAVALACRRLEIDALPEAVAKLISEKASGNPFFTEEMAYSLRDAGHIIVDKGHCRLAPGVDVRTISMPDTVEGVVSERIDKLTPEQQLSLKVASVVGRTFLERLLRSIHPVEADRKNIEEHLAALRVVDLTSVETYAPERLYIFKHIITQQVAYNLMLFSQRRELHRAVAEWHEMEHAADLAPFYPTLAHHYAKAENDAKAIDYLEQSGMRAVASFANEEAISFLDQAMALAEKSPGFSDPIRRALWNVELGEAYYALGRHTQSREHLNRALTLLGRRPPGPAWRHATSLVWQAFVQTLHRLFPKRFVREAPQSHLVRAAARANERLCQIYYMENAKAQSMNAAVAALNLAEQGGASPELARGYANVTCTTALVTAYRLSDKYEGLALGTSLAINHTPSLAYSYEVAGLYHAGAGHREQTETRLIQSIALAESIGDRRRWDEATFLLGVSCLCHGRLAQAKQHYDALYAMGRRRDIVQVQLWGLTGRVTLSLAMGGDEEAYGLLEQLLAEYGDQPSIVARADAILAYGTIAEAHLRAGDARKARIAAERVVRFLDESETVSFYLMSGYQGLGAALTGLFALRRAEGASEERRMLKSMAWTFIRFTLMYPAAKPLSALWRGVYAALDGKERKARRLIAQAAALAQRLDMPYVEAMANRELARIEPAGSAARKARTEEARALFAACGAARDGEELDSAIAGKERP